MDIVQAARSMHLHGSAREAVDQQAAAIGHSRIKDRVQERVPNLQAALLVMDLLLSCTKLQSWSTAMPLILGCERHSAPGCQAPAPPGS